MPVRHAPIELQGNRLEELQVLIESRQLPPVDRWDPPYCGHSGIRIERNGSWLHEGQPIRRPELVRLFASILRREPDGRHMLVTPVEKLQIDVVATAFRAIEVKHEDEGRSRRIAFKLDSGDCVSLGPDHPLQLTETSQGPSPRLAIRFGLEAELTRPVFYELAELAIGESSTGVWSEGVFFPLDGPA
jgi:uncharacterized protein